MKTRRPLRRTPRPAGFSLAELLVVLVIIGLLATVVVRNVWPALFKAHGAKVVADISAIEEALTQYAVLNNMVYPDSLEPLITPDENNQTLLRRTTLPKDPWGEVYMYEPPDRGRTDPRIFTYGADKTQGGEGKDRDIDNFMIRDQEI